MANALSDPKRLRQLQIRRILNTPREEAFDRLTRLAAQSIDAPVALLTFVDDRRQWFKSSYGLAEPWSSRRETPLSHSFCQLVVANRKPLVVIDARNNPLVQETLAIPEMGVEAYLGAPLIDSDGSVLGSFAVIDINPREWAARDIRMVEDFAAISMLEVQIRTETAKGRASGLQRCMADRKSL